MRDCPCGLTKNLTAYASRRPTDEKKDELSNVAEQPTRSSVDTSLSKKGSFDFELMLFITVLLASKMQKGNVLHEIQNSN